MKTIKNVIKLKRGKKFTQKEMATALGMSERQYRRIETGESGLTILMAYRIASLLEVSVDELWSVSST